MIRPAFLVVALATLTLGACQSQQASSPLASAVPGVTPQSFRLPEGAGCAGDIDRFRAIIDNDLETGHTTQGVHARMSADLNQASSACSAGRDAEARAMVRATRSRFGYPA